MDGPSANSISIDASGNSFSGASAEIFTFSDLVTKIIVGNNSGETFLVRFGADDASATVWDVVCKDGNNVASWPGGIFNKCSIYSTGAATKGSGFNVRGVPYVP